MDLKSAKAELQAVQLKLTGIVDAAKSENRNLTEGEVTVIEAGNDRALALRAAITRMEKGDPLADLRKSGEEFDDEYPNGIGGAGATSRRDSGAKGFITPGSIDKLAKAGANRGIKALVAGGSSATPVPLDKDPIKLGQPSLGLLSLIPTKVRETPAYSYLRQTVRTNNAAVVAVGGTKPVSVFTTASVPGSLAVVAHLSEYVDKYLLEDNEELERFLKSELQNGIVRKVTADAVTAFGTTAGIQTQAFSGTAADSIYLGASAVGDLGYNPSLIIINRDDYDAVRLSKDAEERYFGGNPFEGGATPGLWGITTLLSSDIATGSALVLDAAQVGLSVDRSGIVTDADAISGFAKNEVRFRTEGRFGYDVFAPAGVCKVDLTEGA